MSVCIAAVAEYNSIVMVSDTMISLVDGAFSADHSLLKGAEISRQRWGAAFAGDVHRVLPIVARVRGDLAAIENPTSEDAAASVVRQYHQERTRYATENHLGVYGMDMASFLANGDNAFGQDYGLMRQRIEDSSIGCTFLVHGFDADNTPHLIVVDHPGVAQFVSIGYWAIGSGSYMALSRLSLREQHPSLSLEETVYNVLEAKSAAERAWGVGKMTKLEILHPGESPLTLSSEAGSNVLRVCQALLTPEVPKALIAGIKADLTARASGAQSPPKTPKPAIRPTPRRGRKAPPPSQA